MIVETEITIYATWWCGDCSRVRRYFDRNAIRYIWIDVDKDPAAEQFVMAANHGMRSVPTIVFPDGSILVEPTEKELDTWFEKSSR
ncbi:MAG: NrdH-redoxin [Anaerolineales bacterium]|nr:MAG: NrdH-redoxin [Anaerolineales bacterium]